MSRRAGSGGRPSGGSTTIAARSRRRRDEAAGSVGRVRLAIKSAPSRLDGVTRRSNRRHGGLRGYKSAASDRFVPLTHPTGLRRESRADKPYSTLACPFRRSCHRSDLAAMRINQKRRRHPRCASNGLESLKDLGAGIGIIAELVDAGLPEPLPRLVGIAGIDVDGDNLEAGPPESLLQRVERGHFPPAGDAPRGPEVQEDGAPAPLGEMPFPGICIT